MAPRPSPKLAVSMTCQSSQTNLLVKLFLKNTHKDTDRAWGVLLSSEEPAGVAGERSSRGLSPRPAVSPLPRTEVLQKRVWAGVSLTRPLGCPSGRCSRVECPGEGAASGQQVATAAAAMQRAQEGHGPTTYLLSPGGRLTGPRGRDRWLPAWPGRIHSTRTQHSQTSTKILLKPQKSTFGLPVTISTDTQRQGLNRDGSPALFRRRQSEETAGAYPRNSSQAGLTRRRRKT